MQFESGRNSSAVVHLVSECFWCFVAFVFGVHHPNFPLFLQMGKFGPHPHHSAFGGAAALGVGCSCAWGLIFIGGLELVVATVLLVGGIGQTFLNSKRFPYIFPASGHGVLVQTGVFSIGGGLFSGVPCGEGL